MQIVLYNFTSSRCSSRKFYLCTNFMICSVIPSLNQIYISLTKAHDRILIWRRHFDTVNIIGLSLNANGNADNKESNQYNKNDKSKNNENSKETLITIMMIMMMMMMLVMMISILIMMMIMIMTTDNKNEIREIDRIMNKGNDIRCSGSIEPKTLWSRSSSGIWLSPWRLIAFIHPVCDTREGD